MQNKLKLNTVFLIIIIILLSIGLIYIFLNKSKQKQEDQIPSIQNQQIESQFIIGQTYISANGEKYVFQGVKDIEGVNRDIFRYTFSGNLSDKWQDMALKNTFSSTSFDQTTDWYDSIVQKIKSLNQQKSVKINNIWSARTLVVYYLENTKPQVQNVLDLSDYYTSELKKINEYAPIFIPDFDIIDHN